jgi:two-component system response regulator MprA
MINESALLVVDDDPRITDLVRCILAYEGYSVAIAASGNEALNRSLEHPPELIVLDIKLPVLDGLEMARRAIPCPSCCSRHATLWLTG